MSDSVRSHRQQPTRLPRPWDSPAKNTGVGCHFLLQCRKVKSESEVTESCPTLSDPMDCGPPGSSVHGIFQAKVLEWGAVAFSTHTQMHRQSKSTEKLEMCVQFFCLLAAAAAARSLQLCSTLCDPIDGSPPGSAISGILQARTLEWVAISFSI